MEEYELMKDSKYRMYVAAVDKALKNFEYTSEWADLIAALGKLNKVSSFRHWATIVVFDCWHILGLDRVHEISCDTTENKN